MCQAAEPMNNQRSSEGVDPQRKQEQTEDLIMKVDADTGTIYSVNAACARILGYQQAEMMTHNIYDTIELESCGKVEKFMKALTSPGDAFTVEFKRRHKSGGAVDIECTATLGRPPSPPSTPTTAPPSPSVQRPIPRRVVVCVERDITVRQPSTDSFGSGRGSRLDPELVSLKAEIRRHHLQSSENKVTKAGEKVCDFLFQLAPYTGGGGGEAASALAAWEAYIVTSVNRKAVIVLGVPEEEIVGRNDLGTVDARHVAQVLEGRLAAFTMMREAGNNSSSSALRHRYVRRCASGNHVVVEAAYVGVFSNIEVGAKGQPLLRSVVLLESLVSAREGEEACLSQIPDDAPVLVSGDSQSSTRSPARDFNEEREQRWTTNSREDDWDADMSKQNSPAAGARKHASTAHQSKKKKRQKAKRRSASETPSGSVVDASSPQRGKSGGVGASTRRLPFERHRYLVKYLGLDSDDLNAPTQCVVPELRYPLVVAAAQNNSFRLSLLLALGADCNIIPEDVGFGALHMAVMSNSMECVSLLVANGADLDMQAKIDDEIATPLAIACKEGYTELVKALLGMGADVGCRDQDGNTPLHYAVELDHVQIVEALLGMGANVMAANKQGVTPANLVDKMGSAHCGVLVKDMARRISDAYAEILMEEEEEGNGSDGFTHNLALQNNLS